MSEELRAYFEAKTVLNPNGCIEWAGTRTFDGYGEAYTGGKKYRAHRLSWMLNCGAIPDGLWVLHRCDNPPCINPDHLFLGTNLDNSADKVAKGRQSRNERNRSKTHCSRGHEFNEINTLYYKGHRQCRACMRIKAKKRYDANAGARLKRIYRLSKTTEVLP